MSLKNFLLSAASIALLSACGDTSAPAKLSISVKPATPVAETIPALAMKLFADHLTDHGAVLRLTECDEKDAIDGYTGADDQLNVLDYQADNAVSYDAEEGKLSVKSIKERAGVAADLLPIMTHGCVGTLPREGVMVVWGGIYRFDETGTVYPACGGETAIGHLTLNRG